MQAGSFIITSYFTTIFLFAFMHTQYVGFLVINQRVDDIGHFDLCRQLLNFQLISRSKTIDFVYSFFFVSLYNIEN